MNHLPMPLITPDLIWKFWDKIDKTDYCWLWTGYPDKDGYGKLRIGDNYYRSNRISYWIFNKIDPEELEVCHDCDNPPCVRPEHLFLETISINNSQAFARGRHTHIGSNNPQAKQKEEIILKIRSLEALYSQSVLAEMFGYSQSHISAILNHEKWKHI